jgi:hypothetical protein
VYKVVTVGFTVMFAFDPALWFQVYVSAPKAFKLVKSPLQITLLLANTLMVGLGLVASMMVVLPEQMPDEPVTV